MSKNIKSVLPTAKVDEAAEVMKIHNIKKLPVITDNGELVGIITITDIANNLPNFLKMFNFEGDDGSSI